MTDVIEAAARVFSPDYATARRRFVQAAAQAGGKVMAIANPRTGPAGELLATDIVSFGADTASKVLVMVSATHGVEGFCGSGCQLDWLEQGGPRRIPADVQVIVVHAINPHGFAWIRRVTEEGVDLNRNFVNFAQPLPTNSLYAKIADDAVPDEWIPGTNEPDQPLLAAAKTHGHDDVVRAMVAGQYTHPTGLFYGGSEPTWSRRTLETILATFDIARRKVVGVIDFHTGMGQYGTGELMCKDQMTGPAMQRAIRWWGPSVAQMGITSADAGPRTGLIWNGFAAVAGDRVTFATLEYGTYLTYPTVLQALRGDHWLHGRSGLPMTDPAYQTIKATLKEAFFPDHPMWRELVLFRSRQVIRMALAGLGTE
jgi:hypothetical protein